MRYLNKIFVFVCFFGMALPLMSEENPIQTIAFNNTSLFGRSFKQASTLGVNKYLEYTSSDEFIGLKLVNYKSRDFARVFIKDRMALFNSVFDVKRVDYPGQYSKTITCPDEFKPKLVELDSDGGYVTYYYGYANKNKTTGACVADLLEYKYSYGFVLCFNKGALYEFEHYSALNSNSFDTFSKGLACE
jgi:hypothetical protein